MILIKEEALRNYKYKNNRVYIFECIECKAELKVQQQYIPKHSGLCVKCAQFDKPFKACYSSLIKSGKTRSRKVDITYDQFLKFTEINNCHYCNNHIEWYPHTTKDKVKSKEARSYKLDRKDNNSGYTVENCVVCCKKCNEAKGNRYTYEEWYGMTEYFRRQND